ncbi:MAG TPA: YcaO-like family protein, partial [Nitrososphaeraceae archaeon]
TEIIPVCNKIGVTRLSDITDMDRLYVPNYSAVLPGTDDLFWVYSGKGVTKLHAKAGALMEAIERYSSFPSSCNRDYVQGTYLHLSKIYNKVLHPGEVVEPVSDKFSDKESIADFLVGFDLLNNEEVLVPAEIALYRYLPRDPASSIFSISHTNGLASGNVLEEAVCHALCEVIERDAISIADLCASCIPFNILDKIWDSLKYGYPEARITAEDTFVDDSSIFPEIDISEIVEEFSEIKQLVRRFIDTGVSLVIKDITQKEIGIPTFVAGTVEWISHDYGYFAKGFGTHPDSRIALVRAITEASQTRVVNIHGARDDLKKIYYKENDEIYKRKWQFMPATSPSLKYNNGKFDKNNNITKFCEIQSFANNDILDDIKLITSGLKNAGIKRVIIVDLTSPDINIPVVRAIVPGLETFEVSRSLMGRRAKDHFKKTLKV